MKNMHPLYDYFSFTSLLRVVFNPFVMCHTNVIRHFLNQTATWNESSTLQKYITSMQPCYFVLKYA